MKTRTFHPQLQVHFTSEEVEANVSPTGIRAKVENTHQYEEYLEELKGLREELGVNLKEDLYPEGTDSPFYNP